MRSVLVALVLALGVLSCGGTRLEPRPPPPDPDFLPMPEPKRGDWLWRFPEQRKGQTFETYRRSDPLRATEDRHVLAFVPVGGFSVAEREVFAATVDFAGTWFELPVRVLDRTELPGPGWRRVRRFSWRDDETVQYHTAWFLGKDLPRRRPRDALVLVAVTMGDLFPDPEWNYVFGQARFDLGVAVYSLARHFPGFWGEPDGPAARRLALLRSLKLVTHELGHCFGLAHCPYYLCNMNGSNSLSESDRSPLRLCPICLEKLTWNRGFDPELRYCRLLEFYRGRGLSEEADWTARRLERLERRR
jgi:archaemetzincin